MTDNLTPEKRSRIMRAIRGVDTEPEMIVRRMLHSAGYRYRLHGKELPGRPDLVFPSRRKVIQVHGCFWHVHKRCGGRIPDSDVWRNKLARNVERDRRVQRELSQLGWQTFVVWECDLKDRAPVIMKRLIRFLDA